MPTPDGPPPVSDARFSRGRGITFMGVGVGYAAASVVLGQWLDPGWIGWGVVCSGVLVGSCLSALGYWILKQTP